MKSKQDDAKLIAEAYAKVEPIEVQEEALGALAAGIGRGAAAAGRGAAAIAKSPITKKVVRGAGKVAKKAAETAGGAAIGAVGGAAGGAAKAVSGVAQGAIEGTVGAVQGAVDGATGGIGAAAKGAGESMAGSFASDEEGENKTKALKDRVADAKAKGDIDDRDAASIMSKHNKAEDGERKVGRRRALPSVGAILGAAERGEKVVNGVAIPKHEEDKVASKKKFPRPETGADLAARISKSIEDAEHEAPVEVDVSQNPDPESLEVTKEVEVEVPSIQIQPDVKDEPHVNYHDDSEIKMALAELYKIEKYAFGLGLMLKELPALEGWTAAKITKAADYLGSVFHKLDYDFASCDHVDGVEDGE